MTQAGIFVQASFLDCPLHLCLPQQAPALAQQSSCMNQRRVIGESALHFTVHAVLTRKRGHCSIELGLTPSGKTDTTKQNKRWMILKRHRALRHMLAWRGTREIVLLGGESTDAHIPYCEPAHTYFLNRSQLMQSGDRRPR